MTATSALEPRRLPDARLPRLAVTVIVPTYRGRAHIERCLRSLVEQSLDQRQYDVIVVRNGADDGTDALVERFARANPAFQLRLITLSGAGASAARNLGLAAARGAYVTFVDDDDWVSPTYLSALLSHSSPSCIGLAVLANVAPTGPADFLSNRTRRQLELESRPVPAHELPNALAFTVAKLAPTALARAVGFDTHLRSGEDVEFWARMLRTASFDFWPCPIESHAVYYRSMRPDSVSRQELSYDFNVQQRLDVIERLERLDISNGKASKAIQYLINGQSSFINQYLRTHPAAHSTVIEEIHSRGLRRIQYSTLNRGVAETLAILYVSLPFSDTSALVAARRIRKAGTVVDVISSDMAKLKDIDSEAETIWREYVGRRYQTPTRPVSAWWPAVSDFCRKGMQRAAEWEADGARYRHLYSRTMWPAAHILAAWYKATHPEVEWRAEFSDPLLHNITGEVRMSSGHPDPEIMDDLAKALIDRGFTPPPSENMYLWIESLAYGLADTVVFTNTNQQKYMLDYFPDRELAARAAQHAVVDNHPTLAKEFYEHTPSAYEMRNDVANIGYFGVFYSTRGLTEVASALASLDPTIRARVTLHVFTPDPGALQTELDRDNLGDVVRALPFVPYLEFLNLATKFDVLLVNDARATDTHGINPYMPSKWSDYQGSGTPIWAIVEPGSVLSTKPMQYRSSLGDVDGARTVIQSIVAQRFHTDPESGV